MKKDILGAIIERRERINSAHIPTWDELPSLNLYMDQLIFILSEIFEPYFDDVPKLINKAIINNYVKLGYIPAPVKKKYSKEHIAYLVVVCSLKQVMPIAAISALVKAQTEKIPLSEFYDNFCANREKAVLAALGEAEIGIGDPEYPKTAQTSLSLALSAQAYSIVSAAVAQTLIPEEEPKQKKKLTAIEYISISIFKKVCFFIYLGKSIAFTEKI